MGNLEHRKKAAAEVIKLGNTQRAIAQKYGVSYQAVKQWVDHFYTKEEQKEWKAYRHQLSIENQKNYHTKYYWKNREKIRKQVSEIFKRRYRTDAKFRRRTLDNHNARYHRVLKHDPVFMAKNRIKASTYYYKHH
jgi:hypothetical protein